MKHTGLKIGSILMAIIALTGAVSWIIFFLFDSALTPFMDETSPVLDSFYSVIYIIFIVAGAVILTSASVQCFLKDEYTEKYIDILKLDRIGFGCSIIGYLLQFPIFGLSIYALTKAYNFMGVVDIALLFNIIIIAMHKRSVKRILKKESENGGTVDKKHFGWKSVLTCVVAFALSGIILFGGVLGEKNFIRSRNDEVYESESFTEFETKNFIGETVTQDILKGHKYTLVNCWATFCNPCIGEMPSLEALNNKYYGADFQIIGVCGDLFKDGEIDGDKLKKGKDIVEQTGVTYTNLIPNGELSSGVLSNVIAYPTNYILDENGNIIEMFSGANSYEQFEKRILDYIGG